jgi:hypothetical protein
MQQSLTLAPAVTHFHALESVPKSMSNHPELGGPLFSIERVSDLC